VAETLGPGSQLAGYRITGALGQGGMGTVYAAEHAILGRRAALKTLLPALSGDGDFRERFIAESQMVAALDHPSIIPIYDAGEVDGVVYIAMRYVSGGDLSGLIEDGQLEPERAISILEQVAGALDAAHASELVHRDVKPANVLIEADGGRVYLTDFGIAKRAGTRGLTRTGFFVGTLDYAAPEQIRGEAVGPPADVYAFGCLLFESLTGKKPFDRETDVAVMHAQLHDPAPPVTDFRPDLPDAINGVVDRALAKDKADRYQGCRELIEAVRTALGGGAVDAAPRPLTVRARTATIVLGLPVAPTPLIGRAAELASVLELAHNPDVRLLTLTGLGGTGKTRLAIAAASQLAMEVQRAAFVDLAPTSDPALVGSTIARGFGVEESADTSLVQAIGASLGDAPALAVLDNFEQVLPAASFVHDLLAAAPGLTVLVTSQAPLNLREERTYPVPPLEPASAVELFVDRAQAVKPSFELGDDNREAVEAICTRLDGLPLALELAAARVKLLTPANILSRLGGSLDLLTGGAGDLPERQRTLRRAIEWSYNLLDPPEQRLFARLGVFAGGCSLEVADAVCTDEASIGSVLDALASLVDKSLVRQWDGADGEPRFGQLESIREFARERLEAAGELDQFRRRHAERYLALVQTAEPELTRANQAIWLERLDEEADNIRAAITWAIDAGEAEAALLLAGRLVRFWSTRGLMAEGRRRLQEAFAAAGDVTPETLAVAHFAAGYTALGEGDFGEAKQAFERSHEAAGEHARGAALAQLAWLAMAGGEDEEARGLAEQSLSLAQAAGDTLTESGALGTLGELAARTGDYAEAVQLYERGLELRRARGDRRLIANSLLALGRMALLQGDYDGATALLEEGLAHARAVKDTWSVSVVLANLGRVKLLRDDPAGARLFLADGLRLARDRNDRRVAAELVQALAAVMVREGREADAARLAGAADALRESTGAAQSPAELLIVERFLAAVRGLEAERTSGRRLGIDEALDLAGAPGRPSSAETVASPTPPA